jgi:hypothetical protein
VVGESFEQNVAGSCEPACWTYFKDPDVQASVSVATYTPAVDQSKVPYNKSAPKALHGLAHLGISIKNQKAMPDADGIPGTGQPGSPVYHGGAGARNRGMGNEGLYFEGGKEYEGYLYFSVGAPAPPVPGVPPPPPPLLEVALEGDSLRTLAAQRFVLNYTNGTEWNKLSFSLTPNETTSCVSGAGDLSVYCGTYEGLPSAGHTCIKCGGSFRLRLLRGSVGVDFVTLMPGAWGRLHDKSGKPLPVLKSGADVLQQMGTQIIRQGGARETQTILLHAAFAMPLSHGTDHLPRQARDNDVDNLSPVDFAGSYVCDSGSGRNGDTPSNASWYEWQKWTGPPVRKKSIFCPLSDNHTGHLPRQARDKHMGSCRTWRSIAGVPPHRWRTLGQFLARWLGAVVRGVPLLCSAVLCSALL